MQLVDPSVWIRGCGSGLRVAAFCLWAGLLACASRDPPPKPQPAPTPFAPAVCAADEVREYFCDGLLPMSSGLGAPAPFANCPAGVQTPSGAYPARASVARFDVARTTLARERAKPGHACCYSWCAKVLLADPAEVLPNAGCEGVASMPESYCFPELEAGTSLPGPAPFERCPLAVQPPEVVAFSVPKAAPLDVATTQQQRSRGGGQCCYGWCSRMPAGMLPAKPRAR